MGHLYPENISKYLIHKLFRNWVEKDELNNPKPLKIKEVVQYFMGKIKQMRRVIVLVENKEDIELLTKLMEEKFGVNCAEECYLDESMLKMTINECLAVWKGRGIVIEINDEWFIKREILRNKPDITSYIILYIEL